MLRIENRTGLQALEPNQLITALEGNYVKTGLEVSLDEGRTLQVDSGTIVQSGEEYEIDATEVTVSEPDEEPRKDVVYVNSEQEVVIATGGEELKDPDDAERFDTARPSPPSLKDIEEAVSLAVIWVEPEEDDLVEDDLQDRRVSKSETEKLRNLLSIDSGITNDKELTNFEGNNLNIDENGNLNAEDDTETFTVDEFFVVAEPELDEILYTGDDFGDSSASITNNLEGADVVNNGFEEDEILNDFSLPESSVRGVAVDPKDGTLWYVTVDSADIINIERDGTEIQRVEDVLETSDTENIAIDPFDGTFWVVENNLFEVVNIDRDGDQIGSIDVSDVGDDSDPEGVVVDPLSDPENKRFFYGEGRDDELHYIDEDASVLDTFSVRERLEAIEVDPRDGSLWTVFDDNDNDDNELIHFTRTGEELEVVYSASPGPKWSGLSIDPVDNTFWITRGSDDEIFRIPHKRGWLIEKDGKDYLLNRGVR